MSSRKLVSPQIQSGAELVAYLEQESVIGMWAERADIGDSIEYAQHLRQQSNTRTYRNERFVQS